MKKVLSVILLLSMLAAMLASCGTGIEVKIEYIVNGDIYQTNTFAGSAIPTLASDPKSDQPCAVFEGWYFDENVWKQPLTLQSLQDLQLKEKASIKVFAHFTYEHIFEDGVCVNCNTVQESNNIADASDFEYDIITSHTGSSNITIKGGSNATATKIVIPEEINQIPVTTIAENTFFALPNLEEVVVPSTVDFVQSGAFVNCQNLKKVSFSCNKMRTLYDGTFKGCIALETIVVPNPIIIEESLFTLSSLKTIEFNGTLEESVYNLHLVNGAAKPGVILKCTDGEKLLSNYVSALFYQPNILPALYSYAETPDHLPDQYIRPSTTINFSIDQIETAYRAGELAGLNYFVCDADTVEILIEKNLISAYDASLIHPNSSIPTDYWEDFNRDGLIYAFAIPVTKYSFDNDKPVARGNTDIAYLVCLRSSDGGSHIDKADIYEKISTHFHQLISYYFH